MQAITLPALPILLQSICALLNPPFLTHYFSRDIHWWGELVLEPNTYLILSILSSTWVTSSGLIFHPFEQSWKIAKNSSRTWLQSVFLGNSNLSLWLMLLIEFLPPSFLGRIQTVRDKVTFSNASFYYIVSCPLFFTTVKHQTMAQNSLLKPCFLKSQTHGDFPIKFWNSVVSCHCNTK